MTSEPPTSLRNTLHFPPFATCPSETVLDFSWYHSANGTIFKPVRHWCFLGQIVSVEHFFRLRLVVRDVADKQLIIAFYLDNDAALPTGVKSGDTIAVLYAHQHGFLDGTVGLRLEQREVVQIIPMALAELMGLSDKVQSQMALVNGKRTCHGCGKDEDVQLKCSRCGFAWYCGKACQETGWRERGHKKDCKAMTSVRGFFDRDWTVFGDFWKFPL